MSIKQTQNFNNERGRRIAKWLALIERDRNYGRILFLLPLRGEVTPEVAQMARRFGYAGKRPPKR